MTNIILTVVSLNDEYNEIAKRIMKNVHKMSIKDYIPIKKTVFYVSPANSLGFMDGGIDYDISRIIMPGIERILKNEIKKNGKTTLLGRKYLPIGSCAIVNNSNNKNYFLASAPTMLLPQDVSGTQNCYHATRAALYNIIVNCRYDDCEIIFTSMACGWGKMTPQQSFDQFIKAVKDFDKYTPKCIDKCVIDEPNLDDQPLFYENTEWKKIDPRKIINK